MNRRVVLVCLFAMLGVLMSARTVESGQVPTFRLTSAPAKLEDGFGWVTNVRELSDGRVLLSVSPQPNLIVADFRSSSIEQVGNYGSGPGEYRDVGDLRALGGDSTLVPGGEGRWLIFSGTTPVHTLRAWVRGFVGMSATLQGADRNGRLLEVVATKYGKQSGERILEYNQNAESLAVIVHRRAPIRSMEPVAGRPDTLAVIRGAFREVRSLTRGSFQGTGIRYTLYTILDGPEQAVMFADGWVAIAYSNPYRVEWYTPDRKRIVGLPLPFERVAVDEKQKLAAIARDWPLSPTMFRPDEYPPWPQVLPAFQDRALVAMEDGRLAIRRTPDAHTNVVVYDLVDRAGRLTGRLLLRGNEELKAISSRYAYLTRRDRDDLIWVERYAWPPG